MHDGYTLLDISLQISYLRVSRLPLSELEELDGVGGGGGGCAGGVSSLGEVGGLGSGVVNLTLLTLGCSSVDLLALGG